MDFLFKPKFFTLLKQGISKQQVQSDILSGTIVGIVALPLAIAFAVASGLSPDKGIITAVVAGFIISMLGGSRVQIGGPTGAYIVIVFGIVQQYGLQGLLISTILAGILLILFGILKLGIVLKFIPHPLIVGFTSGIALVIFSTQIKDAAGLEIVDLPSEFIGKWASYFTVSHTYNIWAIGITIATILITLFTGKFLKKIPGSFIAIVLLTAIVSLFNLPVNTIGKIYGDIPNNFSIDLPAVDWHNFSHYLQPAFTIAMLGAIESLLSAVVADGMIGTNHRSNTELIAQGIANVVTPFFGGMPATGAIARTATNVKNGGRTPIAGMVHALVLLLIMLILGKWAKLIPMACLAGILIVVAYNMSEWRSFVGILKGSGYDIFILLVTFLLTVFVDLTMAIQIGMVLAALLFMQRMSNAGNVYQVEVESDVLENYAGLSKGINVYEISGPYFFAAAKSYNEVLKNIHDTSTLVIIRMRHVPFIDSTGIRNFRETLLDLKSRNIRVILSGVREDVLKDLVKSKLTHIIGQENIFNNFNDALIKAESYITGS